MLFGLESVDSTVFHIGGIDAGLGVLAIDIEGPVLTVLVPIQGNTVDFVHIQTVLGIVALDQTFFNQGFTDGCGIGLDLKGGLLAGELQERTALVSYTGSRI